ncbi:MAG: peroxiredoxin-like family protein [Opitutales bacterium]
MNHRSSFIRCLPWLLLGALPSSLSAAVPSDAADATPIEPGTPAPDVTLTTAAGDTRTLTALRNDGPAVLVFYRGGWCPYCNTHLGELKTIEDELGILGYRLLAVSPDRPGKIAETATDLEVDYTLLSDSPADAMKAFGVAFRVPQQLVDTYRTEYGIDLEADSGETHHILPVPSVFVIDADGVVRYVYSNADYKVRLDPEQLLAEAKAVQMKE